MGFVKILSSRHSGESRNPEHVEITGFRIKSGMTKSLFLGFTSSLLKVAICLLDEQIGLAVSRMKRKKYRCKQHCNHTDQYGQRDSDLHKVSKAVFTRPVDHQVGLVTHR